MGRGARQARKELTELVRGRPGWRLEPRTTPGSTPLWCYVVDGEIEYSVTAERGDLRLYVMQTDEELVFGDAAGMSAWLREHRIDALADRPVRPDAKTRVRRLIRWN
jgi:hypothetical protein